MILKPLQLSILLPSVILKYIKFNFIIEDSITVLIKEVKYLMWVAIKVILSEEKIIYLPSNIAENINDMAMLTFGKKMDYVQVSKLKNKTNNKGNDFNHPINIQITSKLKDSLLINENIIYRFIFKENQIKIGPVIGLLLGNKSHLYTPQYMCKYSDRFGIYNTIGGLIYGFSANSIDWHNNSAYGLFYNNSSGNWQYSNFPLPEVIYRRNFHTDSESIKKLINITDNKFFNSFRFTKYDLYEYVNKNDDLASYLPDTELLMNFNTINRFLTKYNKVILKPLNLSRGRGIQVIENNGDGFIIHDYRHKISSDIYLNSLSSVKNYYENNKNIFNNYLIQQCFDLSKVLDSVFDIRVVMQKDENLKWKCSGIECRVAKSNSLITNISKGGYALSINEALLLAFPNNTDYKAIVQELEIFCENLCLYLDKMGHHFAEFGIDIGLDKNKKLWLIEVNVFPSFKGFRTMDYHSYIEIRHTPLKYALSLSDFREK